MNKLNKKYEDFILERNENSILELLNESVLYFSEEIEEILSYMVEDKDPIARIFSLLDLSEVDTKMSYLNIGKDSSTVDFIDSDRVTGDELPIDVLRNMDKYRVISIRIGRLVKKIIELYNKKNNSNLYFSDSEIEKFVNSYKSNYDFLKNGIDNLKLLSNKDDIKNAYFEENYSSEDGTLGSSCMRYGSCQEYFDIYSEVLVLKNSIGQIMGRSVIWTLLDGRKFMDRIYTNRDHDINLFIKYAKQNGFLYKIKQNSSSREKILTPDDNYSKGVNLDFESKTEKYEKDGEYYFPYMDTMKYLYWEEGIIRNFKKSEGFYVFLEETDGEHICVKCNNSGSYACRVCYGDIIKCNNTSSKDHKDCEICQGSLTMECDKCDDGISTCDKCGGFNTYN